MNPKEARQELLQQAGCVEESSQGGFLTSLRPYVGLDDRNFHLIVESILSLNTTLCSDETVDRELIYCIWRLTVLGRVWGVDEDGMLVRNGLISAEDRVRLKRWIEIIEKLTMDLFAGMAPHETIHSYCEHNSDAGWGENFGFFLPLISQAIQDVSLGDCIEGHAATIAKLGPQAASLRDVLLHAESREFDWNEPADRCTTEMRRYIRKAISSIDGDNFPE